MTPPARYAAAIDCLDRILNGNPAEKTLTNWARASRYAGSKDRAAVRDIVFDCLRQKRSLMHRAGFQGARALAAAHCLGAGNRVGDIFTGTRYAPNKLTPEEQAAIEQPKNTPNDAVRLDIPDWIMPRLKAALGEKFDPSLAPMRTRAPVDIRVNFKKTTREDAQRALAAEGIESCPLPDIPSALRLVGHARHLSQTQAYQNGWVELQDAGAQAVIQHITLQPNQHVLDYCAGGGGKTLALGASAPDDITFFAYDIAQDRMTHLSERAARAGLSVSILKRDPTLHKTTYDCVILDAPCSGTGTWRRTPDYKWQLKKQDVLRFSQIQADILKNTQHIINKNGFLIYITCSLLPEENEIQIQSFLRHYKNWHLSLSKHFYPSEGTDGFFLSILQKKHF